MTTNQIKVAGAFDDKFIKQKSEGIEKLSLEHYSYTLKTLDDIYIT